MDHSGPLKVYCYNISKFTIGATIAYYCKMLYNWYVTSILLHNAVKIDKLRNPNPGPEPETLI